MRTGTRKAIPERFRPFIGKLAGFRLLKREESKAPRECKKEPESKAPREDAENPAAKQMARKGAAKVLQGEAGALEGQAAGLCDKVRTTKATAPLGIWGKA